MPTKIALKLYELTLDPLLLDAIRAISDPKTPEKVVESAQNYVETCYSAALLLFRNSGKYADYERTNTRFTGDDGG